MNRIAPAPLDKGCRSSLSAGSEAPLEQDFQTPDGSPVRPFRPATAPHKLTLLLSCLRTIPLLSCFWGSDHLLGIDHPTRSDTR